MILEELGELSVTDGVIWVRAKGGEVTEEFMELAVKMGGRGEKVGRQEVGGETQVKNKGVEAVWMFFMTDSKKGVVGNKVHSERHSKMVGIGNVL
jgi:hypothetical protein